HHFAQGCDLIDALLQAVKERDVEIAKLHAELRRLQERVRSTPDARGGSTDHLDTETYPVPGDVDAPLGVERPNSKHV
ncbi:MAG: hypothetical protein ACE5FJ_07475, partial [Gemmatimonadales bacterium]